MTSASNNADTSSGGSNSVHGPRRWAFQPFGSKVRTGWGNRREMLKKGPTTEATQGATPKSVHNLPHLITITKIKGGKVQINLGEELLGKILSVISKQLQRSEFKKGKQVEDRVQGMIKNVREDGMADSQNIHEVHEVHGMADNAFNEGSVKEGMSDMKSLSQKVTIFSKEAANESEAFNLGAQNDEGYEDTGLAHIRAQENEIEIEGMEDSPPGFPYPIYKKDKTKHGAQTFPTPTRSARIETKRMEKAAAQPPKDNAGTAIKHKVKIDFAEKMDPIAEDLALSILADTGANLSQEEMLAFKAVTVFDGQLITVDPQQSGQGNNE